MRKMRRRKACAVLRGRGTLANDLVIGPRARWLSQGRVVIAKRVYIGADFFLEADLVIGEDVLVSSRVAIIGDDHPFDNSRAPVTQHGRRPPVTVTLEGDNLIGHGTIILGPSTVGRGTIVGAGSLVIGDLPPDSVCVGRPAKVVKSRRDAS